MDPEGDGGIGGLESDEFRRGPGGRPSRAEAERRHRVLLETARRLLLERGWEATSIDEVLRQSGVAKRFFYARYPDKASLFIAAFKQFREDSLGTLKLPDALPDNVGDSLIALGERILDLVLGKEALASARLVLAEAPRLRGLIDTFHQQHHRTGLAPVADILGAYAAKGQIELADLEFAAEHFLILVMGVPQRLAMFGLVEEPERQKARLRAAVDLFLNGCRK